MIQEAASAVAQQAHDVASDVADKAQDMASTAAHKVQETAAAAVRKTDQAITAAGHQMNAFGGKVRETAPHDGMVGSAATAVADGLQAGGRYLEGHGLQEMGKDLTDMVRHYPIPSVLVGFGLGCLLGMTLRRR